jgi:hypothetical protein
MRLPGSGGLRRLTGSLPNQYLALCEGAVFICLFSLGKRIWARLGIISLPALRLAPVPRSL